MAPVELVPLGFRWSVEISYESPMADSCGPACASVIPTTFGTVTTSSVTRLSELPRPFNVMIVVVVGAGFVVVVVGSAEKLALSEGLPTPPAVKRAAKLRISTKTAAPSTINDRRTRAFCTHPSRNGQVSQSA